MAGAAVGTLMQRPPRQQERACNQSKTASDRIGLDSQLVNQAEERRRLTKEQEVIRESLDRGDGSSVLGQRWANHGARGQTLANKFAWLRQDQVRLVEF